MQDSQQKNLQVVIGLGQSGLAAANFLLRQGYQVAVTDGNPQPTLANQLPEQIQQRKFGDIDANLLRQAARIIISPGVPLTQPAVSKAIQAGIPVVSDIQVFHEALKERDKQTGKKTPIVAITGSSAKSTVTTLVGIMAKDAGVNAGVGGNIGVPALTLLDDVDMELAVLELSSFQLETVTNLNAQVATILNLSPDHLDRHGDMAGYLKEKQRIFDGVAYAVVNRDDDMTKPENIAETSIKKTISFGSDKPSEGNFGLIAEADGQVFLAFGSQKLMNTNELKIKGQHNQMNALAALALGHMVQLPIESMLTSLKNFAGLPHRCQFIANVSGVDYFNDSKGTNMGSTMAAIKGLGESYTATNPNAKLMLIVGGQGKGQNFAEMAPLVNQYVGLLLCIGEDGQLIQTQLQEAQLKDTVVCKQVGNIETAIKTASEQAKNDDNLMALLLSPACASFDQFGSYVLRGEKFIELVGALA